MVREGRTLCRACAGERYYRPAYFGDGWIGIRLDIADTDWDAINDWLSRSWRSVAPRRLTALMDAADSF